MTRERRPAPEIEIVELDDGRRVARVHRPESGADLDAAALRELALALLDAATLLDDDLAPPTARPPP